MDRAPAGRGTRVLCLNPTGSAPANIAAPLGVIGLLSRSIAGVEALALERKGARVTTVSPDDPSLAAIGTNLMNSRRRSRVIAAESRKAAHSLAAELSAGGLIAGPAALWGASRQTASNTPLSGNLPPGFVWQA